MYISFFFLSLQLLVLGTVHADLVEAMSPSQAKLAASYDFFPVPAANISPSSHAASITGADDAIFKLENSQLTCHTDFPMADMAGFEVFVEACTLLGKKATLLMTHLNLDTKLLRYIDPAIAQEFLNLNFYAYELENKHDCRTSNQEKTHCIWLSRLRDELSQFIIKMGGPNDIISHNGIDLKTLNWELEQISQELDQIVTDVITCMSLDSSRCISVTYETVIVRGNRLQKLIERAAELEKKAKCPDRGLPFVCETLRRLREVAGSYLERFPGQVDMDA